MGLPVIAKHYAQIGLRRIGQAQHFLAPTSHWNIFLTLTALFGGTEGKCVAERFFEHEDE